MSCKDICAHKVCEADAPDAKKFYVSFYAAGSDGSLFLCPAPLSPEVLKEAAEYQIVEKIGGVMAEEKSREIRPEEIVFKDGHFHAVWVYYHESEDYNDRTWEVTREEIDSHLILLPGKGFVRTDDGCYGGATTPVYSRLERK